MKIFIGVPIYGNVPLQFVFSLLDFFHAKLSVPYQIKFVQGESLIPRARNKIAADFLLSDCTHLLFVDCDILFTIQDIERLLAHADKDIVGGLYAQKCADRVVWCVNTWQGKEAKPGADGLINVKYTATGFMLIARRVFEKMVKKYGKQIVYHSDCKATLDRIEYDFFRCGVVNKRYLSEDWYFCDNANNLGFKVYAHSDVILRHWGGAAFPLMQVDVPTMKQKAKTNSTAKLDTPQISPDLRTQAAA